MMRPVCSGRAMRMAQGGACQRCRWSRGQGSPGQQALLVRIKRDLENQIRGLLKNLGLIVGRAKMTVAAMRAAELTDTRPELAPGSGAATLRSRGHRATDHRPRQKGDEHRPQ
jgi:hypothetical protein